MKDLIDKLLDEFMWVYNLNIVNLSNVEYIEDNYLIIKGYKIVIVRSYKECLLSSVDKLLF